MTLRREAVTSEDQRLRDLKPPFDLVTAIAVGLLAGIVATQAMIFGLALGVMW